MHPLSHLSLALAFVCALASGPASAGATDTLAIVAVEAHGWVGSDAANDVQDAMTSALVADGRVRLIERQDLRRVMKEQALSQSGAIGNDVQIRVGQLLGARWVAVVKVKSDGGGWALQANVLETNSGAIVAAEMVRIAHRGELESGSKRLAVQTVNRLSGTQVAVNDFDPVMVREAGRGLSLLLSKRLPALEGRIVEWLPTGTATCQLPREGAFEGQRFEITGYDEVTEQVRRKGLFLLTAYGSGQCNGRLRIEPGNPVEDKDKLKSLPVKIALEPLERGEGAEAEMARQLFEETRAFLKLQPNFEVTSPAEAQLSTSARISGPRGKRAIQVQILNVKTGAVIRLLDLVGTF